MPIAPKAERYFLGIDPGATGGLVLLTTESLIVTALKMPETEVDLWQFLGTWGTSPVTAVVEQVGGYVGKSQPGSMMFAFGKGYGAILMGLVAAGIPFSKITPRPWQKALGIPSKPKEMKKPEWKRKLKSIAQERFPKIVVTGWMADALLLADYCRRKELGLLK